MAGKALKKRLLIEIGERGGPEWLQDYIADGGTIARLAEEMGCSRTYLSRHLNAQPEYRSVITEARAEYADKLADEALEIADDMATLDDVTREQIAVAKERIDVRKWLAAVNSPDRFRQNNNGPSVTININQLHLEALKKHRDGGITIEGTTNVSEDE
jgi:AraC-like DNA-binding protein